TGRDDHLIEIQVHVRVIGDDPLAQSGNARLQRIPTLFFLNHPNRFARDDFRRWQIRLAEPETDTSRLRAIRNLSDHALLDAAEKWRWLEGIQRQNNAALRVVPASR